MDTLQSKSPAVGQDHHESVQTYRHGVCENCGRAGHAHDKERVYPDDGPAGTYHYRYVCPTGA